MYAARRLEPQKRKPVRADSKEVQRAEGIMGAKEDYMESQCILKAGPGSLRDVESDESPFAHSNGLPVAGSGESMPSCEMQLAMEWSRLGGD